MRVRSKGFRRRCAGPSLVRTRPWYKIAEEPSEEFDAQIFRTMEPTFIADYESISTASWSTVTNARQYTLTGVTGDFVIMDPIRWVVYEPAAASDRYDFTERQSAPQANYFDLALTNIDVAGNPHGYHALLNTILPASGNSHFTLKPTTQVTASFVNTPQRLSGATATASVHKFRHRVNGTAVGSLQSGPVTGFTGSEWGVALNEGDTYEIDVWTKYQLTANGSSVLDIKTGVNTGGIADNYSTLANARQLVLDGLISYGWDKTTHKYNLTFTGGDMTTLASETFNDTNCQWTYNGTTYFWTIQMDWLGEIPLLSIGNVVGGFCWYVPQDSSDYILTTTRPDLTGTQLWKMGCFDWDGTTTFVPLWRYNKTFSWLGKRSGTFDFTDTLMPSSVSVAYAPV